MGLRPTTKFESFNLLGVVESTTFWAVVLFSLCCASPATPRNLCVGDGCVGKGVYALLVEVLQDRFM